MKVVEVARLRANVASLDFSTSFISVLPVFAAVERLCCLAEKPEVVFIVFVSVGWFISSALVVLVDVGALEDLFC